MLDFETDPEFEEQLAWMRSSSTTSSRSSRCCRAPATSGPREAPSADKESRGCGSVPRPEARRRRLGQMKLALMSELIGRAFLHDDLRLQRGQRQHGTARARRHRRAEERWLWPNLRARSPARSR